jgi:hypothetical protein
MTSHRLQVTVAPIDGAVSATHSRIDGNGRPQPKLVVLDEGFVEEVRVAYSKLDLTCTHDIPGAIWVDLTGHPDYQEADRSQIETALIYLADQGQILLPYGDE